MFINNLDQEQIDIYSKYIRAIASLSGLFSESNIPFLHYRAAENIFCKSFNADNLSRADIAYDAKLKSTGIGLKTFISSTGTSREKIAEFNSHSNELRKINKTDKLIEKLSELRNERILFANRTYGIEQGIYHCLTRQENKINIFETDYQTININCIRSIKETEPTLFFQDEDNEYSFNFSKSTLYRKFYTPSKPFTVDIEIIRDPYELILKLFNEYEFPQLQKFETVILPLYSTRNRKKIKIVPEKSGLNQWNAGGRKRNLGEVYIPIPQKMHQFYPRFFPSRDKIFKIILPTQDELFAKICQEGGKALMTNPNNALSQWLLRKVLKLELGEILTYTRLKTLGIDSVKVTKIDEITYKVNFAKLDSYEKFEKEQLIKKNKLHDSPHLIDPQER